MRGRGVKVWQMNWESKNEMNDNCLSLRLESRRVVNKQANQTSARLQPALEEPRF